MVTEILVQQKDVASGATETLKLECRNRRVRKVGIYAKRDGVTLDSSDIHEIQTSDGKMDIGTQIEDSFEPCCEPIMVELSITVTDTSLTADQQVTLRVQVV